MLRLIEWKVLLLVGVYFIGVGMTAPHDPALPELHSKPPAQTVRAPGPTTATPALPSAGPAPTPEQPGWLGSLPIIHKP